MAAILLLVLFNFSRNGLLTLSNGGYLAITVGFVVALTAVMSLLPERSGPPMTTLSIETDRVWFSAPRTRDRDLPLDKPGYFIVLEDRDPVSPITNTNNQLASGRPRFYVSGGDAVMVPVTGGAYLTLKADLQQRGISCTPSTRTPKTGQAREILLYRVPGGTRPGSG
jgi:hypothetical protein